MLKYSACYAPRMQRLDRRGFLAAASGVAALTALRRPLRAFAAQLPPHLERIAQDPDRPSCHLLPPHNWMNDPNGPIWWRGQYHLFYQLNPNAAVWGDMHWGHAVSPDMIHWRHQPIALAPTPGGPDSEGCFSGSAVVFNGVPTFIYTGVQNAPPAQVTIHDGTDKLRETQLLATAEDDALLHWMKDPQPVIAAPPPGMRVTGFRDPCPWREPDGWYLGVGSGERNVGGCVLLYRSQDLRHWTYLGKLAQGKPNGKHTANPCDSGEMWECPDFFPLDKRHCLFYSTEGKVIWTTGSYEPHSPRIRARTNRRAGPWCVLRAQELPRAGRPTHPVGLDPGDTPEAEYAAAGWAGCMSLPRVLHIGAQGQLEMEPAHEVERLRGPEQRAQISAATPFRHSLAELRCELHLRMNLLIPNTATVRLSHAGKTAWELVIDIPNSEVRCGDIRFPLPNYPWPRPNLRLFLDGSVIEIVHRRPRGAHQPRLRPQTRRNRIWKYTMTGPGHTSCNSGRCSQSPPIA